MYKTSYHSKYLAHRLILKESDHDQRRLGKAFYDATIQLNPHQVEAALFAFKNPESKGVILADEVGLGKTIEAGLIIAQCWSEMKRRILVIAPPALMKQWQSELEEKFSLKSEIMDTKLFNQTQKKNPNPLKIEEGILIVSYDFAKNKESFVRRAKFDIAILDEAHKLRNITERHTTLKKALESTRKVLLTATPIQNSIQDLYNLCAFIDASAFGNKESFNFLCQNQPQFAKDSLQTYVNRTLRKQVADYVKYPKRQVKTFNFVPLPQERQLYDLVMDYLHSEHLPSFQQKGFKALFATIIRKQLASSTPALISTLEKTKARLWNLYQSTPHQSLIEDFELELEELDLDYEDAINECEEEFPSTISKEDVLTEIQLVEKILTIAKEIQIDSKTLKLLETIEIIFKQLEETSGANKKVLIFTESKKTQDYLYNVLQANGYHKIVRFSGTNKSEEQLEIYQQWKLRQKEAIKESRNIAIRKALVEEFKDRAEIMIATESGSEGLNLQFCSALINYDLPWNPQRIEQRIGRCHRYGQKVDVVVFNFINTTNHVEKKTYELLDQKFKLFEGLFGSSDAVLGLLEHGNDLEKKLMNILLNCRNQQEVDQEFELLQKQYSKEINQKLKETQKKLLEHFDEDISQRFHQSEEKMKHHLESIEQLLWELTKIILYQRAIFDEERHQFLLEEEIGSTTTGLYQLVLRSTHEQCDPDAKSYKFGSELGQYVIQSALNNPSNRDYIEFDLTGYSRNISGLNQYKGQECYLNLTKLKTQGLREQERLLLTGMTVEGEVIEEELLEKLFKLNGTIMPTPPFSGVAMDRLEKEMKHRLDNTVRLLNLENDKSCKEAFQQIHKDADLQLKAIEGRIEELKARRDELNYLMQLETSNWSDIERYQEEIIQVNKKLREARQAQTDEEEDVEHRTRKRLKAFQKALKYEEESIFTIKFKII